MKILITGGAGFVGSHLADEMLKAGYEVRVLDNLTPQVHGPGGTRPDYLHEDVELQCGDIRDREAVARALEGVDAVYHFAAAVGVGQSMYQIEEYTSVNNIGTAILLEALAEQPVKRLIVASSMSLYGEGLYKNQFGEIVAGKERTQAQLKAHDWEVRDEAGEVLFPVPTPETKEPSLPSVYAISKYDQERLCHVVGRAYNISTVSLRFFNIYGTRQALSNPYTGVLAIFAARYLNGLPPLINEDGLQRRDFIAVEDVVQACRLALEVPKADGHVFNVGTGHSYSILEVAQKLGVALNCPHLEPKITGSYRKGDIRNCFADITRARQILGYRPKVNLDDGLLKLAAWLDGQVPEDRAEQAREELLARGLSV